MNKIDNIPEQVYLPIVLRRLEQALEEGVPAPVVSLPTGDEIYISHGRSGGIRLDVFFGAHIVEHQSSAACAAYSVHGWIQSAVYKALGVR